VRLEAASTQRTPRSILFDTCQRACMLEGRFLQPEISRRSLPHHKNPVANKERNITAYEGHRSGGVADLSCA